MNIYSRILQTVIEIEGLTRVMEANPSSEAEEMLTDRIDLLNSLFKESLPKYPEFPSEVNPTSQKRATEDIKEEEGKGQEGKGIEHEQKQEEPTSVAEVPLITEEEPSSKEEESSPKEEEKECEEENPSEKERVKEPQEEQAASTDIYAPPTTIGDIKPGGGMRLDEVITRKEFSDLRKAFTLNDRFRFTHELFGDSEAAFRQTVATLASLPTLEDAREFLLFDLGFNEQNESVSDFLAIIQNHYQQI